MKKETFHRPAMPVQWSYRILMRTSFSSITLLFFVLFNLWPGIVKAQNLEGAKEIQLTENRQPVTEWYQKFAIRGYAQVRYNQLLVSNPDLSCEQCDKSWGKDGGFFIRRMRIIFFGQIHKRIYFYVQPDFASSPGGSNLHFTQLRDAYMDIGIDKKNEFRFRIGQSKVPFGFENMQSSQNRLPLDRNDALNSAVANERDLGVFFMYAPQSKRKLFSYINRAGLKGSGDYGVFAFGVYNGQTANKPELNNEVHIVSRVSYPFEFKTQIIEVGLQAYRGNFVIPESQISKGVNFKEDRNYCDERFAGSFTLYPQPFGITAEYNIGRGPEFNKYTNSIEVQNLHGGYVSLSYLLRANKQIIIPFSRYQYYDGGKKHELDARSYEVSELEIGVEWQPFRQFELVAMYTFSKRRYEDFVKNDNLQEGSLLRLQAQVNF